MPKYYIKSGEFKFIVDRQSVPEAVDVAISKVIKRSDAILEGNFEFLSLDCFSTLDEFIVVSEEGFSDKAKIVEKLNTLEIVQKNVNNTLKDFGKE